MNRLLVAVAIATVALAGCATEVDDPLPIPAPPEAQKDPPRKELGGEFNDPFANIASDPGRLPPERIAKNPPLPDLKPAH